MKANQLFEQLNDIKKIPFEYEVEWENDPSWDPETQPVPVVVFRGYVYETPDVYATGDSPTEHSVEFTSASYKDTKQLIPFNRFNRKFLDFVEEKAIESIM